ncbi:MAG: superoxide dismutase family protein [Phycisphaeraceae bacterium]
MTTTLRSMQMMLLAVLTLGLAACGEVSNEAQAENHEHHAHGPIIEAETLVAVMRPTAGNDTEGTVVFTRVNGEVRATAHISGLTPDQQHAIHIHQFGDERSDDGTSAGGHYNPEGHEHGLPDQEKRHAGDLGNLEADDEGNATFEIVVNNVTLASEMNPILGRGVIIHAGTDDGSQPTGAAGSRIASGVIGVANPDVE